ncbi:MAG: 4'-phosphopantetheinyl transferase superfamily protein [Hymenobacteraceae bacterium]|nr:4'-phosphopantetheinyl transferase superfamily protein [Hymenobacteraceae bacterium]MDX5397163.1 4'-phosphopantetheinyl transferase superfamily protein [Hymenobacteraceae bacterium]MDX5513238.1 4'-phosphopantetheinyl transferase superfamily protein [Hymenobacteraceae bacterium]
MPLQEIRKLSSGSCLGIWHITEAAADLQALAPELAQQADFDLLKTEKRQKEWLASRLLVHRLQQEFLNTPLPVQKNAFGKPVLPHPALQLSLSHSGDLAAAILADNSEVGIDIELVSAKVKVLSGKFLSETEMADAAGDETKTCVYWSAKETLYKLYGRKKLLFIENLPFQPFELQEKGQLIGQVNVSDAGAHYVVYYEKIKNYILTYCAGEKI